MTEAVHPGPPEPRARPRPRALGRAWADLPLRAKGLMVVAIPVLALLGTLALLGLALAEDRAALDRLRDLVTDNPVQAEHLRRVTSLRHQRQELVTALISGCGREARRHSACCCSTATGRSRTA